MKLMVCAALMAVLPAAALANDTMAVLGTGGLTFFEAPQIRMQSEDLYVSPDEVRVRYEFVNDGVQDMYSLVAFPMPDITGSPDFLVSVPTDDPENLFDFHTTVNGQGVDATLHQYAFMNNIDQSEYLTSYGVPLAPHLASTGAAIDGLDEAVIWELLRRQLVVPIEYDSGQGWEKHYIPVWTLRSAYSFDLTFPLGSMVTVEHSYKPSVGGTVAVTFMREASGDYDPATEYKERYCTDQGFLNAVRRTMTPGDPYSAPFTESWLNYIWSTATNWSGPIGQFRLVVDKGREDSLVSFCWDGDGEVTKIAPTRFEMRAENFVPPEHELEILILNRVDQPQSAG
jgi:hypothetical protein